MGTKWEGGKSKNRLKTFNKVSVGHGSPSSLYIHWTVASIYWTVVSNLNTRNVDGIAVNC